MSGPASGRYAPALSEAEVSGQIASLQSAPPTNTEIQSATRALTRMSKEHSEISVNEGMLQLYLALKRAGPGGARVLPQAMKTWRAKFFTEARFMQTFWVVDKSKGQLPEAAFSRLVDLAAVGFASRGRRRLVLDHRLHLPEDRVATGDCGGANVCCAAEETWTT